VRDDGESLIRQRAPVVDYSVKTDHVGEVHVVVEALPTHRITPAHELLVATSIGDAEPVVVRFDKGKDDENDQTWQTNVLRSTLFGADAGVVNQRITIVRGTS
jgi:hypothetical protein